MRLRTKCRKLRDNTWCGAWRFREAASCSLSLISEALHVERQFESHRCSGLCRQLHITLCFIACCATLF